MTFGISVDGFPANQMSTVNDKKHLKWLAMRRAIESRRGMGLLPPQTQVIMHPGRYDVLYGRGQPNKYHHGNLALNLIVEVLLDEYNSAPKGEKTAVADKAVEQIRKSGGRFLKQDDSGCWLVVENESDIREKVCKTFWSCRNRRNSSATIENMENAQKRRLPS